jgi:hypothetical protein
VREHIDNWFIFNNFKKSHKNDTDVFTKNVSKDAYAKHASKFLGKVSDDSDGWISEIGRVLECIPNNLSLKKD